MFGVTGDARRLLRLQCWLTLAAAGMAWILGGSDAAGAALYGGATAMVNAWMSGRRLAQALEVARVQPGRETSVLYIGAIQRFVMLAALFMLGMGALELLPLPMLAAFAVAYSAIVWIRPAGPPQVPASTDD
ncbi:MAG: ATP synthase subunit I [Pseudomonadota bacterium]